MSGEAVCSAEGQKKTRTGEALFMESSNHPDGEDLKETKKKKEKEVQRPYLVSSEVIGSLSRQKLTVACQKYPIENQKIPWISPTV